MSNKDISLMEDESGLSFSKIIYIFFESKLIIFGITFVILFVGILYSVFSDPIYESDLMIQVEDNKNGVQSLMGDLAPLLDAPAPATAEIELMGSRAVLGDAVKKLNLNITSEPKYFPIFGKWFAKKNEENLKQEELSAPFMSMYSYAWGGEFISLKKFEAPTEKGEKSNWELIYEGDEKFSILDSHDNVVLKGKVGEPSMAEGISIEVSAIRARKGVRFNLTYQTPLQAILYLQDKLKISEKGKQSGVIVATLEGKDPFLVSSILNTMGDVYVSHNIERKSEEAEKTIIFLDKQLPGLKKELDVSEEKYNEYRNKKGTINLEEEAKLLLQQSVDGGTQLLELQQKKMELLQRYTSMHPSVVAVDTQISIVRGEIEALKKKISKLPDTEQEALRLMRDVTVNNDLYTNLLNTAQQLRILKAGKVGNVHVVDWAVPAEVETRPKKLIIIISSLFFGFSFGMLLAVIRKSLFGGVEDADEIEKITNLPVLASIPLSGEQANLDKKAYKLKTQGLHILAYSKPEDVTVESLRSLRTALQFAMLEASNNIVMITGPAPGVGKSFVSANLAAVLALEGKRILLIDADMRRGHLHELVGVTRNPGLSALVTGNNVFDEVLRKDLLPGLDFVPIGEHVSNPSELLASSRFSSWLSSMQSYYDLIIIDTPPILVVTDAAIVGKYAGATLLNFRYGQHQAGEIMESVKRLQQGGVVIKGVLLNGVPRSVLGYGKYKYYGGYYAYEYGNN